MSGIWNLMNMLIITVKKHVKNLMFLLVLNLFMNVDKKKEKRMTQKAFIRSQIGYCSLVWIFHSWGLNNKTNWIHERASRISHKDKSLSFQKLLKEDNSATIHHSNIKILAMKHTNSCKGFPHLLWKKFLWKETTITVYEGITF